MNNHACLKHIYIATILSLAVAELTKLKMSATAGDNTLLMRIVLIGCLLLSILGLLSLAPPFPAATSRNARKSRYIVISGNLLSHHDAFRLLRKALTQILVRVRDYETFNTFWQLGDGALCCLIIVFR
jgi:hypothetical protein